MSGCTSNHTIEYLRFNDLPGVELFRGVADTRFVSRHMHELFCLTIAEAGVRICETRKGKNYLTPGVVFISNCGESHSGSVPNGQSYSCRSLRLDAKLLDSFISQFSRKQSGTAYFPTPLFFDRELYQKIWSFHNTATQAPSTLTKECQLLDVFFHLVTRYSAEVTEPGRMGDEATSVRRACEYLHDCFAENVPINKLSSIAALSPFHFCRVFEKEIGIPPHVYQMDIRLTRAARLLSQGKRIADVAVETGFFDQSHFHKAFCRKFGITPKRYAQN